MLVSESGEREGRVVPERAEIGVAIFKTSRPVRREAVFPARAHGPAGACGGDGFEEGVREHVGVVDIRPGATTRHVEQRVVEGEAESATDRGLGIQPEVGAVEIRQAISALDVGAFDVTFQTEDELTKAAADRASGGFVERRPARGANGREQDRDEAV